MPIIFLEFIQCFEIAVEIVANVIPGVARIVYLLVRPGVGEEYFTSISPDICERVEDVANDNENGSEKIEGDLRQILHRDQRRRVFSAVYSPAYN